MENWKQVEILGESYFLRPTFDIVDYVGGVCGFDVHNEGRKFIAHYDIDNESALESQIKWDFYRVSI